MRRPFFAAVAAFAFLLAACGGSSKSGTPQPATPSPAPTVAPSPDDQGLIGKPQNRSGIGDVDLAFGRYGDKYPDLVQLYKSQPWFQDGLTRDEALFVERGLSFVGRYNGPRNAEIPAATIQDKLYKYDKIKLSQGDLDLLLIYEPGDDADAEMSVIEQVVPEVERLVGVQFPEKVLTIVNGDFEINDFNDGQFIRIARCCVNSAFVLAHELSHTYWSMASSWFIEGMADLYANFALADLNKAAPPGWKQVPVDLAGYYKTRKAAIDAGRYPNITLPTRFASDGLYEVSDVFLLDIRTLIGEDQFSAAAREIYLTSDFGRYVLRDKRIEDIFLKYAKASDKDTLMAMFNKSIWGDNGEKYQQMQEQEGN